MIDRELLDTKSFDEVYKSYKRGVHKKNYGGLSKEDSIKLNELKAYLYLRSNQMRFPIAETIGYDLDL